MLSTLWVFMCDRSSKEMKNSATAPHSLQYSISIKKSVWCSSWAGLWYKITLKFPFAAKKKSVMHEISKISLWHYKKKVNYFLEKQTRCLSKASRWNSEKLGLKRFCEINWFVQLGLQRLCVSPQAKCSLLAAPQSVLLIGMQPALPFLQSSQAGCHVRSGHVQPYNGSACHLALRCFILWFKG